MKHIFTLTLFFICFFSFSQTEIWGTKTYGGKSNGGILFNIDPNMNKVNIQHRFRSNEQKSSGAGMVYIDSLNCFIGYSGDHLFKYNLVNGELIEQTISHNIFGNIYYNKNGQCYAFGEYIDDMGPTGRFAQIDPINLNISYTNACFLASSPTMQYTSLSDSLLLVGFSGAVWFYNMENDSIFNKYTLGHYYNNVGPYLKYNNRYYGLITDFDYDYSALKIFSFHPQDDYPETEIEIKFDTLDQDYLREWMSGFVIANNNKFYGAAKLIEGENRYYMFSFNPANNVFDTLSPFDSKYNESILGSFIVADNNQIYGTIRSEDAGVSCIFSYSTENDQFNYYQDFDSNAYVEPIGNLSYGPDGKLFFLVSQYNDGLKRCIYSFNPETEIFILEKAFPVEDYYLEGYEPGDFIRLEDGSIIGLALPRNVYKYNPQMGEYDVLLKLPDSIPVNSNSFNKIIQVSNDRIVLITTKYSNQNITLVDLNQNSVVSSSSYSGQFAWEKESENTYIRINTTDSIVERFYVSDQTFEHLFTFTDSVFYSNPEYIDDYVLKFQKKITYSNPDINDSIFIVQKNMQSMEETILIHLNGYCLEPDCPRYSFSFSSMDSNSYFGIMKEHLWGPAYSNRIVKIDNENNLWELSDYNGSYYSYLKDNQENIYALSKQLYSATIAGTFNKIDFENDTMIVLDDIEDESYYMYGRWAADTRRMKILEKKFDIAYWDGEKDSSWYEPMNWRSNALPSSSVIVHINENRPYLPVIDTFVRCRKLIIGDYSSLTISPIGSLTVDSLLINKGELILESNDTNRATLISPVENQQLGEQKYVFQAGSNINHILSNPMNQSVWKHSNDMHIQEYIEADQKWNQSIMFPFSNDLSQTYWYSFSDTVLSFVGDINFEDVSYQNGLQNGQFIAVSNPYTSYLSLDHSSLTLPENEAIYRYNVQTNEFYEFVDGIGDASEHIEPLGAFWMYLEENESLDITASQGKHYFQIEDNESNEQDILALHLKSENGDDKTFIRFNENATADFDGAYDALKFSFSDSIQTEIFTKASSRKLAINQLPDTALLDLFVEAAERGTYTISVDKHDGFDFLVLEDLIWNKRIDLLEQDYSFEYFESDGQYPFKLYFNEWALEPVDEADILIYYYLGSVYVKSNKQIEFAQILFYDMTGRVVHSFSAKDFHYLERAIDLAAGHYIVQLRTRDVTKNRMIWVME